MKTQLNATKSLITWLECSDCGKLYDPHSLQTFATCCQKPLQVNYNLENAPSKSVLKNRPLNMWRYRELLPVVEDEHIISLGEGFTPLIRMEKTADKYGFKNVFIKDESYNPTGSFKARGLAMAISKAHELGVNQCIVPTAGNAGGAMSAYCAKARMKALVVMPSITPKIFKDECKLYGAEVIEVEGLISEAGKKTGEIKKTADYFDLSTLKEPYRIEGKKTMGFEIAEQFNWELPDVIIYPAGGGTGLIGIWKAFIEMQTMGWINGPLPRMYAVQTENCQPLVKAFDDLNGIVNNYNKPKASLANGLAVPHPFGLDLMMKVIHESNGNAVAISEEKIIDGVHELAKEEGVFVCPEGAATWEALKQLKNCGDINEDEKVVLLNTGSGYKYMDNLW